MKHSILLKVGENLIYQCTESEKPMQTTVDSLKDFIIWQNTLKSYLVKKDDQEAFMDFIIPDQLSAGVPIPYDIIELSEDKIANKMYAKINKNVKFDKETKKVLSVGFSCKICDAVEDMDINNYDSAFKVCKACISDLKDYVLSKRSK
jgi:hypothetical protein